MADENVITIDGTDYSSSDLSNKQKYMIAQIKDLQNKAYNVRFQLDQLTAGKDAFTASLIQSIEQQSNDKLAS